MLKMSYTAKAQKIFLYPLLRFSGRFAFFAVSKQRVYNYE